MLVAVIVVVTVLVIGGLLLARQGAARATRRVEARLAGATIVRRDKAELRGQLGAAADGEPQRGLGLLALTADDLVFVQFVPDRELRIPRRAIASVTVSRSLGEATFDADVLAVAYAAGDGAEAEAAFRVPDLDAWLAELGGTRPGTAP